jgi:hypothetical protein
MFTGAIAEWQRVIRPLSSDRVSGVIRDEHPRVVMEARRHRDIRLTMKLYTDTMELPVAAAMARLAGL